MIEVQVFIPLKSNEGKAFDQAHHMGFEAFVLERFGGISLLPGQVAGSWMDEGKIYHDQTRVYLIAMVSLLEAASLNEVLGFAKIHYRQEAIYFRYLGQSEIF